MQPSAPWFRATNVYEVNLRQYTPEGTINAFSRHLPRLRDMGVQTLWFMPITPIAQEKKKGTMGSYYACSDYTAVAEEFGTLEDFKEVVATAHGMGFKVILDWVANHTGWDHRWTREHPEYYKKAESGGFHPAAGMDDIIELDFTHPPLRKAMTDAMRFWLVETGIDGFRCDLAFWVEAGFWKEARAALDSQLELFWLAELDPVAHPEYMETFDAAYTWSWMQGAQDFYAGRKSFAELMAILQQYESIPGDKAWFTTNHDENSWNGTEYEKYGELAPALAVFSCTWPGIPLVYTGQEIANTKRIAFFDKDPLSWPEQPSLHGFYKLLLKAAAASENSNRRIETDQADAILAYQRGAGLLVILNFSNRQLPVRLLDENIKGEYRNLFSGMEDHFEKGKLLHIEAWGYRVYELIS
jgi:alpha-amylase